MEYVVAADLLACDEYSLLPKSVDADRLDVSESPELKPDERARREALEASDESDDRDEREALYELDELDEPKPLDRLELDVLPDDEDDLLEELELELELEPKPEFFAQPSGVVNRASEAVSATRRARVIYLGDPMSKQYVGCVNVGPRPARILSGAIIQDKSHYRRANP